MTLFHRSVAATVVVLSLVTLGACHTDGKGGDDGEETRNFEVSDAGVSFELPGDWEEFDPDKMAEVLSDSEELDKFTDRMGIEADQFQQLMNSAVSLVVTAPHAEHGMLENVTVAIVDAGQPSTGELELQYRSLGATHVDSHDVQTDLGDGLSIDYEVEFNGIEVSGNQLVFEVDGQTVFITTSTVDRDHTNELADGVVDTLAGTD